jgi:molybdopterin adenylyltransferase
MPADAAGLRAHRAAAERVGSVAVAIITVSDTRTPENDGSGGWLRDAVGAAGHEIAGYTVVPDEPRAIDTAIDEALATGARVVLLTGGTGISARDGTPEVVRRRLTKELSGFGELFRMLSYREIGSAAMLSRALAGTVNDGLLVALPGSTAAVQLAWRALLAPEIEHMVALMDQASHLEDGESHGTQV